MVLLWPSHTTQTSALPRAWQMTSRQQWRPGQGCLWTPSAADWLGCHLLPPACLPAVSHACSSALQIRWLLSGYPLLDNACTYTIFQATMLQRVAYFDQMSGFVMTSVLWYAQACIIIIALCDNGAEGGTCSPHAFSCPPDASLPLLMHATALSAGPCALASVFSTALASCCRSSACGAAAGLPSSELDLISRKHE